MFLNRWEFFYYLTLNLNSKHSVNYFLPNMQMIIIISDKDWHDRVIYQNSLGIFSCSLVPNKELRFSSNIYLLPLLLDQLYPRQSFSIRPETKDLLKMENIGTDHKGYIYVFASDNLCSQINKLVLKRDRVRNTKEKHAHKLWLDPYRETWRTSLSISFP